MISEKIFIERIYNIPNTILSKTGTASYTGFKIDGELLHFHRVVPKTNWNLNLKTIYQVYLRNDFINTAVVKRETGGRVNSPTVAILLAIGCIDERGNRINEE